MERAFAELQACFLVVEEAANQRAFCLMLPATFPK